MDTIDTPIYDEALAAASKKVAATVRDLTTMQAHEAGEVAA